MAGQPAMDPASGRALLIPAWGLRRIRHLAAFFPGFERIDHALLPRRGETEAVAGWGHGWTALYARGVARAAGLPYIAVEDGFLRSIGLGEAGAQPISLVTDEVGIYYDARRPSGLEELLERGGWETPAVLERARDVIERLVETGLSKTNATPPGTLARPPRTARRRILLIDQTLGDRSIRLGGADAGAFLRMLDAARRDEPDAELVLRLHPAVAAGHKRGHFHPDRLAGVTLLTAPAPPGEILSQVDAVYTVTSLMGFEALMRGLPVRCFGLPFYAGWGATRNEVPCSRRSRRRSVLEIFAAAYLIHARYVDPLTGRPCEIETVIERLLEFRERATAGAGFTAAVGFAPWKQAPVRALLYSPMGQTRFFASPRAAIAAARKHSGRIVLWAGRDTPRLSAALAAAGRPLVRMEDGFVRSRGLGSDFHPAASVVLDDIGIHYDASRPSRLERILAESAVPPETLARAAALRRRLVAGGLSKYNLAARGSVRLNAPAGRRTLLVVGQVENDRSIILGCGDLRTNLGLLQAARRDHPGDWIVYKPHPDVESGARPGRIEPGLVAGLADETLEEAEITRCLDAVDALATLTSLAGFEMLMREKPVFTYGRPFYAGWGLTVDALDIPRRTRRLTLDELVAGALIAYPIYVEPSCGLPCEPETLVDALCAAPPAAAPRRVRYWRAVAQTLRGRPPLAY